MTTPWENSAGELIEDANGTPIECDECPCGCPAGSALYKIKYAEKDTSCTAGAANEYRLNIACSCKCLITGDIPNPIPEGKTAADYHGSYPITGETEGVYWKKTIAGGPFTDDDPLGKTAKQKCDEFQVDGCAIAGCEWYKIRTAYYDPDCTRVRNGYNLDSIGNPGAECECRCLITGTVPSPIPAGKTAEDYYASYPIQDATKRIEIAGGPYVATCDKTAEQVCADHKLDGCDFAWDSSCNWDYEHNSPSYYYKFKYREFTNSDCTENGGSVFTTYGCQTTWMIDNCYPFTPGRWIKVTEVLLGPYMRSCDLP